MPENTESPTQTVEIEKPVAPEIEKPAEPQVQMKPVEPPAQAGENLAEAIELERMECLELRASNAMLGKLMAEHRLIQLEIEKLQREMKSREEQVQELNQEQDQVLDRIGVRLGVGPAIRRYLIDVNTGKGKLAPRRPPARG